MAQAPEHPAGPRPRDVEAAGRGGAAAATGIGIAALLRTVDDLRTRLRRLALAEQAGAIAAVVLGSALVLMLLDYAVRLPASIRGLALAGLVVLAVVLVRRRLLPALRFRPARTDVALRLESLEPGLAGRLASAIEFEEAGETGDPLVRASIARTVDAARSVSLAGHADARRARREGLRASGVVVIALLFAVLSPALAATGLARLALPWSQATWPARTAVASLMDEVTGGLNVHPRGTILPLRARNLTPGDPEGRVRAEYRLVTDGETGREIEVALTYQEAVAAGEEDAADAPPAGGVHERLVDTGDAEAIEVRFATADARTRFERVRLEPPPAIVASRIEVTPPAYTAGLEEPLVQALGPGTDASARTERAVLEGARATFVIDLLKPLPVPDAPAARAGFLADTFGWRDDVVPAFTASDDPPRWTLAWTVERTRTIDVALVDEWGLQAAEPIRYVVEARSDRDPVAVMTEPEADGIALAGATLPLTGEASDDVGVASAGLRAAIGRGGSTAVPADFAIDADEVARRVIVDGAIELAPFDLAAGDVVELHLEATDVLMASRGAAGAAIEPVRSSVRRIRIVRPQDLAGELRSVLSAVRRAAIRLEVVQTDLRDESLDDATRDDLAREQARLGERLGEQREVVEEIARRMQANALDDNALAGLLRQAAERLEFAEGASTRAVQALEEAREAASGATGAGADEPDADEDANQRDASNDAGEIGRPDADEDAGEDADESEARGADPPGASGAASSDDPTGSPADRDTAERAAAEAGERATEAQQEVREELVDLVRLLDRDEDTWLVRQEIDRITAEQRELRDRTRGLEDRLLGRELEDLDERERRELEALSEPQAELAEATRRLVEEMRRRAAAMEPVDPQAAAALREAADEAEGREAAREMQQAAEDAQRNRLQNAEQSQSQALEALERMASAMEEDPRARTLELLRRLESLEASIDRLVTEQEQELVRLDRARRALRLDGRDRAMVRLGQNTLAVASEARAQGPDMRAIARALDRAADEQAQAVGFLRETPIDWDEARVAEEASLEALVEALDTARALQEQAQEDQARQARDEIIRAYRDALERQIALRSSTEPLVGRDLDRRERFELRRLGNLQEEIRVALGDVRAASQDVAQSPVMSFVHDRLDDLSARASSRMWDGDASTFVLDLQADVAEGIRRQIEAIESAQAQPEEFDEPNRGGGGAGGGGGGGGGEPPPVIPPVTELKRLAGLQAEVLRDTRRIGERGDLDAGTRAEIVRDVASFQNDVLQLAQTLLERLESGPGGGLEEEDPTIDEDGEPVPNQPDAEPAPAPEAPDDRREEPTP